MHFLRFDLIIEFVAHGEEHDDDGEPLREFDWVAEEEDAEEDGEDFAYGGDERVDVLFKIGYDIVYWYLADYLQKRNGEKVFEDWGVVDAEG